MHVVLAGGTGNIGRRLITHLLNVGHEVTVLTRRVKPSLDIPSEARLLSWDGRQAVDLAKAEGVVDAVINLCGESVADKRWNQHREKELTSSRLEPTEALVDSVKNMKQKPIVFLQASAVGYYGARGDELLDEAADSGNSFLSRLCLDWEGIAEGVTREGVRLVRLRTGVVLDPEGGALTRMLPPFQFFCGGPLGNGNQWFPWIHYQDEVRAMEFLMQAENIQGPVNLTAPEPLTNRDFSKVLAEVLNRPCWLTAPAPILKLIFGEMSTLLLDGQRVVPRKLKDAGFLFEFPDAATALQDLLKDLD